jgi:uncharacterized membrane protein
MQIGAIAVATHARLRLLLVAVLSAAILHILATLAAPQLVDSTPFARLSKVAPLHKMQLLDQITPQTQPIPFMAPDVRYALCRYDTSKGSVAVSARLPGRGWTLGIYTPEGDNFYTALGQDGQPTEIALVLTPIADRFLGLTPEARGKISDAAPTLNLPSGRGMVVIRGPDRGIAYRSETEAMLRQATCALRPF